MDKQTKEIAHPGIIERKNDQVWWPDEQTCDAGKRVGDSEKDMLR